MRKEEALELVARIRQEEPRITSVFDDSKAREDGCGYCVRLSLCQRRYAVYDADEWPSIRSAWQWFLLPEERVYVPALNPPRHLVDGVPMTILRNSRGYWLATYTVGGKTSKKYFGKVDPRPLYPVIGQARI